MHILDDTVGIRREGRLDIIGHKVRLSRVHHADKIATKFLRRTAVVSAVTNEDHLAIQHLLELSDRFEIL
tara:strand:+ start:2596 stop:2805 length:210 start_codon:yes stop_codon:yes gene_type:complete